MHEDEWILNITQVVDLNLLVHVDLKRFRTGWNVILRPSEHIVALLFLLAFFLIF